MGTFATTHSITYGNPSPSVQTGTYTITDGDADTTFETGDTYYESSANLNYEYAGTMVVDGETWPVFGFVEYPGYYAVFMDQAPVTVPDTLDLNSGDTYTGACFLSGSGVSTPNGIVAVEALRIGDVVLTSDGRSVPVKWIGRQTVSTRFGPASRLLPVRIRAGALGDDLPQRDLVLTADHALLIEGLLVNAGALINGSGIDWMPLSELGKSYTVYHIETENHDVIYAEGAAAETYVDYIGRQAFDNHAEYVALYGDDRLIREMPTARVTASRQLPLALRARFGIATASPDRAEIAHLQDNRAA